MGMVIQLYQSSDPSWIPPSARVMGSWLSAVEWSVQLHGKWDEWREAVEGLPRPPDDEWLSARNWARAATAAAALIGPDQENGFYILGANRVARDSSARRALTARPWAPLPTAVDELLSIWRGETIDCGHFWRLDVNDRQVAWRLAGHALPLSYWLGWARAALGPLGARTFLEPEAMTGAGDLFVEW